MRHLTLTDIRALYRRYVPWDSQHPSACERGAPLWWPAHDIGHLLTVPRRNIGRPMFSLAEKGRTSQETALFRAYELAAMSVSRHLLTACGRPNLFDDPKIGELEASNYDVMHFGSWSQARRILQRRRLLHLPLTKAGLEALCQEALTGARP